MTTTTMTMDDKEEGKKFMRNLKVQLKMKEII